MIIKTSFEEGTYFVDNITKKESTRYIPSPKLTLLYTNPNTGVQKPLGTVYLDNRTNVILAKDVNGSTYVIDDGYRNAITRAGYFVYGNYDQEHITDKDTGIEVHTKLKYDIRNSILNLFKEIEEKENTKNEENITKITFDSTDNQKDVFTFELKGYKITIIICDNILIVKKNEERKINGLQFFPFDKNMDNYGTLYCCIYAQKLDKTDENPRIISDIILKDIINKLDNTKFVPMIIKQPLYYTLKE